MNDIADPLGDGLVYKDSLPLRWQPVAVPAAGEVGLGHVDEANAEFLRTMAALEEHSPDPVEEHAESGQQMWRLEAKVDLLLSMVSRLLARQQPLPEALPIRLSAAGIEWLSPRSPATGEHLLIELYLCRDLPMPLLLAGKVTRVVEGANTRRATVLFEGLSAPVRDWLDKLIFRQHRRRIANSRREATKET